MALDAEMDAIHGGARPRPQSARVLAACQSPPVRATCSYMFISVGMVVANKMAVKHFHAGTVLVVIQMLITSLAVLGLHAMGRLVVTGTRRGVLLWVPVGVISGLIFWAGMQAVKYATLSTLTVVRNVSSIFLLVAERLCFGAQATKSMVASLLVILAGVALYAKDEMNSPNVVGVLFILLDASLVCLDRMLERYLLALRPIDMSVGALVLESNTIGIFPLLIFLAGPCRYELGEIQLDTAGLPWVAASCVLGFAIAVCGIFLGKHLSAAGALVVCNTDKVLVLCYGVVVLGDSMSTLKLVGCLLALGGGVWHALARLRAQDIDDKHQPLPVDG